MRAGVQAIILASLMLGDIEAQKASPPGPPAVRGLTLASPDFADGGIIPDRFSLANRNAGSSKLEWTNAPPQTVSFALIFHDPDETLNKTTEDILHWLVFNFPGTARELPAILGAAATLPDGTIQAKSIRRTPGYMGLGADAPGPYHHYTFELFAVDEKLNLGTDATRADVWKALDGHILAKAVLVGRFHL